MWETWVQSLDWEDPLEKEMATHSHQLQSMGSQRVGHDWATSLSISFFSLRRNQAISISPLFLGVALFWGANWRPSLLVNQQRRQGEASEALSLVAVISSMVNASKRSLA